MKTDPAMTKAVLHLTKLRYSDAASVEGKAVGAFCADVLLPLMTERANSKAYILARNSLLARGRNAEEQTQCKTTI